MKERVAYKEGKFTDYSGIERPFVIAAVSVENTLNLNFGDEEFKIKNKGVYFGISVLHPTDLGYKKLKEEDPDSAKTPIYSLEVGKVIAKNKAVNEKTCINYIECEDPGLLSSSVIESMLEQQARYFISNPSKYLAGYEKARITYNFNKLGGDIKEAELKDKKKELEKLEKQLQDLQIKARKLKN